jgi:hypothetical protein
MNHKTNVMKALLLVLTIILLQSCGQVAITNTEVCDGLKNVCPAAKVSTDEKNGEVSTDNNSKMADQTLLLNRIMRSI